MRGQHTSLAVCMCGGGCVGSKCLCVRECIHPWASLREDGEAVTSMLLALTPDRKDMV